MALEMGRALLVGHCGRLGAMRISTGEMCWLRCWKISTESETREKISSEKESGMDLPPLGVHVPDPASDPGQESFMIRT